LNIWECKESPEVPVIDAIHHDISAEEVERCTDKGQDAAQPMIVVFCHQHVAATSATLRKRYGENELFIKIL
jgi:hypothetical protein